MNIYREVWHHNRHLKAFVNKNDLPGFWFNNPDHVAFKPRDGAGYDELKKQLLLKSQQFAEARIDGRRLGTAIFAGRFAIEVFNEIQAFNTKRVVYVELMEPKPYKVGAGVVGLDHIEYLAPAIGLDHIGEVLGSKGVIFDRKADEHHDTITMVVRETGQEVKLSSRPIAEIIAGEIANGQAELVHTIDGKNWGEL